jgi:hypothetical protein
MLQHADKKQVNVTRECCTAFDTRLSFQQSLLLIARPLRSLHFKRKYATSAEMPVSSSVWPLLSSSRNRNAGLAHRCKEDVTFLRHHRHHRHRHHRHRHHHHCYHRHHDNDN